MVFVSVKRETLAEDLWAYGEDELAVKALELSDLDLGRIGVLAGRFATSDEYATPSGAGMMLAKACALAAVEVMEGTTRPLKRGRRRSVPEAPRAAPPPPPGEESPREVFLAASTTLAERFVERGFRYAKSGPHISRREGEFRFFVYFSNHRNIPGALVDFTLYTGVRSNELRRWRSHQWPSDIPPSDQVAGGMLQNLGVEMPLASWNIADPEERPAILDALGTAIDDVALPYFALFGDAETLVRRLETVPVPSFSALSSLEWLLSHNERDAAIRHARVLLNDDRLRRRYERALAQMGRGELRTVPYGSDGEALAYAALKYGLEY